MSEITVAPATKEDFLAFSGKIPPYRVAYAVAGRRGAEILAIGGVCALPDGSRMGFLDTKPGESKRYPVLLHKTTLKVLAELRARGVGRIIATIDDSIPSARAWAKRLGFRQVVSGDTEVWVSDPVEQDAQPWPHSA